MRDVRRAGEADPVRLGGWAEFGGSAAIAERDDTIARKMTRMKRRTGCRERVRALDVLWVTRADSELEFMTFFLSLKIVDKLQYTARLYMILP